MIQLNIEKKVRSAVPYYVVHPLQSNGEAILFYHGWSSEAKRQIHRAAILALHGYTVYVPDALHHGERGALSDYYQVEAYPLFWKTIFQNMEEFPLLQQEIRQAGFGKPLIMGHSMGALSVLGMAGAYRENIKGVISVNGSGDWLLSHLFMQARFGIDAGRNWPLYEKVENASPIRHVDIFANLPLLLLHGESDVTMDPRADEHFYRVLREKSKTVRQITYPKLGHFVTTNMMEDAIQFMNQLCAEHHGEENRES